MSNNISDDISALLNSFNSSSSSFSFNSSSSSPMLLCRKVDSVSSSTLISQEGESKIGSFQNSLDDIFKDITDQPSCRITSIYKPKQDSNNDENQSKDSNSLIRTTVNNILKDIPTQPSYKLFGTDNAGLKHFDIHACFVHSKRCEQLKKGPEEIEKSQAEILDSINKLILQQVTATIMEQWRNEAYGETPSGFSLSKFLTFLKSKSAEQQISQEEHTALASYVAELKNDVEKRVLSDKNFKDISSVKQLLCKNPLQAFELHLTAQKAPKEQIKKAIDIIHHALTRNNKSADLNKSSTTYKEYTTFDTTHSSNCKHFITHLTSTEAPFWKKYPSLLAKVKKVKKEFIDSNVTQAKEGMVSLLNEYAIHAQKRFEKICFVHAGFARYIILLIKLAKEHLNETDAKEAEAHIFALLEFHTDPKNSGRGYRSLQGVHTESDKSACQKLQKKWNKKMSPILSKDLLDKGWEDAHLVAQPAIFSSKEIINLSLNEDSSSPTNPLVIRLNEKIIISQKDFLKAERDGTHQSTDKLFEENFVSILREKSLDKSSKEKLNECFNLALLWSLYSASETEHFPKFCNTIDQTADGRHLKVRQCLIGWIKELLKTNMKWEGVTPEKAATALKPHFQSCKENIKNKYTRISSQEVSTAPAQIFVKMQEHMLWSLRRGIELCEANTKVK